MRNFTKEQINVIAMNILSDFEENVPVFSHMWDCSEVEDREEMIASIEDSIIRRLKIDLDE